MTVVALIIGSRPEARALCADSLNSIYVSVTEVSSPEEATIALEAERPGVVLIDMGDAAPLGLDFCRAMKAAGDDGPAVLIYGGEGSAEARREALIAGADDYLALPRDTALLKARMRSVIRFRTMSDELALRRQTAREIGLAVGEANEAPSPPHIVIAAPVAGPAKAVAAALERSLGAVCRIVENGFTALRVIDESRPDAVVVLDDALARGAAAPAGFAESGESLDFVRTFSGRDAGRLSALLLMSPGPDGRGAGTKAALALDAGAGDCAYADPDFEELSLRLDLHLRRKRCADRLRRELDESLRKAALDPLTGLYNRRYLDLHFDRRFHRARETGTPLSALLFDLDRFKAINDSVGHARGDATLAAFAELLREEVRTSDLACRYGGEEFVVVMPGATREEATIAAERVRDRTARELRAIGVPVTVSVGVATQEPGDTSPSDLLVRADDALREAKRGGRNRVAGA